MAVILEINGLMDDLDLVLNLRVAVTMGIISCTDIPFLMYVSQCNLSLFSLSSHLDRRGTFIHAVLTDYVLKSSS